MSKTLFKNKKILIIGGTGSIGAKVLEVLLSYSPRLVKIFSRNEYKQYQLRYAYSAHKNIEYVIGDVRDLQSVIYASTDMDFIFHCAALKHVPFSEEMPEEFIKTNILGSINVLKAARQNKVPKTISISTDKVVDAANLMGLTKAVQEKVFASHYLKKNKGDRSSFINVRFGNVIGTHGSFFPMLHHQILSKKPITLTHSQMTRFFITSKEAIDLILWAATNGKDGQIIVKKMKSTTIERVIKRFLQVLKPSKKLSIKLIGIRAGEKLHESLITEDNLFRTKEKSGYYVIDPYSTGESIVLRNKKPKFSLDQFFSNNSDNFLTDRELDTYINTYLKELKLKNTII